MLGRETKSYKKFQASYDISLKIKHYLKNDAQFETPKFEYIGKNNVEAEKFKVLGNDFYGKRKFEDAIFAYNSGLQYAEPGTKTESVLYANRSAVYFELKLHLDVLLNIEKALESGKYPVDLLPKLMQRQQNSSNFLASGYDVPWVDWKTYNYPVLCSPEMKMYPFVADCVELDSTANMGQGLFAKRDLKPGEIIMCEDATAHWIRQDKTNKMCYNCTGHDVYNLWPCKGCSVAMYCNECQDEAYDNYHMFECPLIGFVRNESPELLLLLKITSTSLRCAMGSLDNERLEDFMDIPTVNPVTSEELQVFFKEDMSDIKLTWKKYQCMLNMKQLDLTTMDSAKYSIIKSAMILEDLILSKGNKHLQKRFATPKAKKFLFKLLIRNAVITPILSLEKLTDESLRGKKIIGKMETERYGLGVYPVTSLVNHSCLGNVEVAFKGKQSILYVLRPIKAGREIFLPYTDFCTTPKILRTHFLSLADIVCSCVACKNDYPTTDEMSGKKTSSLRDENEKKLVIQKTVMLTKNVTKSTCNDIFGLLASNTEWKMPDYQLSYAEKCAKMIMFLDNRYNQMVYNF